MIDPHVDLDLPERYAVGRLDPDTAKAFEEHLLLCERCQGEVRFSVALRRAARPRPAAGGRRIFWIALPSAAAAAILLLMAWQRTMERQTDYRELPVALTPGPIPIAPLGRTAFWSTLRWSLVPASDRYQVTVFDVEGRAIWQSYTADTSVALPDSMRLTAGSHYYWKVEARTGWRRSVASPLVEFTPVSGGPPR